MHKQQITCDQCGKDLTTGVDYRLQLTAESILDPATFLNPKRTKPPFNKDHHFCNWTCLRDWVVSK